MSSESQGIDYAAVLADLKARRAQIDAAIAVIEPLAALGLPPLAPNVMGPPAPPSNGGNGGASAPTIESDTFFGLSILDAAKRFMAMRKRPVSAAEIIEALRTGGQINAQNESFGNTLGATLSRSDSGSGSVVRVGRGKYGLREWYANKPRVDTE